MEILKKSILVLIVLPALLNTSFAEEPSFNLYKAKVERVIDGDTLVCDIQFDWGVTLEDKHIRCLGYDAWEASKRRRSRDVTDEEVEKGLKAKKELEELIEKSEAVYLSPGATPYDPYGRPLAYVFIKQDGKMIDLALWMSKNGHLRVPLGSTNEDE